MKAMRTGFKSGIMGTALLALAACGGSDTDMTEIMVDPFEDRRQNFATYDDASAVFTNLAQSTPMLPATTDKTTGTVQYDGVFLISGDDRIGSRLAGEASIDVTFEDAGAIAGSVTNFRRQSDNAEVDGTMTLVSDALIRRTTSLDFSAELAGEVTLPEGDVLAYDSNIGGTFRGVDAEGMSMETGLFVDPVPGSTENYVALQVYAEGTPVTP